LGDLPSSSLLGTETYWKGAVVFHALRTEIGDDAFFSGLRDVFRLYGGKTISLRQFQRLMEQKSGETLDDFFQYWLGEAPITNG
jgi:aminopeptidase N